MIISQAWLIFGEHPLDRLPRRNPDGAALGHERVERRLAKARRVKAAPRGAVRREG